MNRIVQFIIVPFIFFLLITGCEETYTPKPKGYFRIELPRHSYQSYNDTCPFSFEYPEYAVVNDRRSEKPCWFNIDFPQFRGAIHLSYKPVSNNLRSYLEDSRTLAYKHTIKAMDIEEKMVVRPKDNVYGLMYFIQGNTASSLQFYLTDSTDHFFRGALYFNVRPNKDSIRPVYNFIRKDVERMVESFEWKYATDDQ